MPNSYMTPKDPFTPGSIETTGTFLYQLAIPDDKNKEPCNLWSGRIDPNNGFDSMYAKQAAALFVAAPGMLVLLEHAVARIEIANEEGNPILSAWVIAAKEAITKAKTIN